MMMMILTAGCLPAPTPPLFSTHCSCTCAAMATIQPENNSLFFNVLLLIYLTNHSLTLVTFLLLCLFNLKIINPVSLCFKMCVFASTICSFCSQIKAEQQVWLTLKNSDNRINCNTLKPLTSKVIIMGYTYLNSLLLLTACPWLD